MYVCIHIITKKTVHEVTIYSFRFIYLNYMKTSGGASLLSFSSSNVTVLERVGRGRVAEERPPQLKFIFPNVVISTTLGCGAKNSVAILFGTKYSSPC